MPSAKYYRTVLDRDCLQLIGDYAGDKDYKLVFTLTKKRGFLSNILLVWRDPALYCNYKPICILKEKHWVPVRLDCIAEILTLLISIAATAYSSGRFFRASWDAIDSA